MAVMQNREILKPSDRGLSLKDVNDCLDGLALSHANKEKGDNEWLVTIFIASFL